jgi:hypothetical protein
MSTHLASMDRVGGVFNFLLSVLDRGGLNLYGCCMEGGGGSASIMGRGRVFSVVYSSHIRSIG